MKKSYDGINSFLFRGTFQYFIILHILKINFLECTFQRFCYEFKQTIIIYQRIEEHLCNRTRLMGASKRRSYSKYRFQLRNKHECLIYGKLKQKQEYEKDMINDYLIQFNKWCVRPGDVTKRIAFQVESCCKIKRRI